MVGRVWDCWDSEPHLCEIRSWKFEGAIATPLTVGLLMVDNPLTPLETLSIFGRA